MVYFVLRHTIAPLLKALFVRDVRGLENLPKKGPYIVASNHASYADPVLLGIVLTLYLNEPIHFIAMKPLSKYWFGRVVIGWYFQSVFVNGSVHEGVEKLQEGGITAIFPEGGRTFDGELQKPVGTGTAVLAYLSKAPVIPVGIKGSFNLWPRFKRFPKIKKSVEFCVGEKKFFKKTKPLKKDLNAFIRRIMDEIAVLCDKRYYF